MRYILARLSIDNISGLRCQIHKELSPKAGIGVRGGHCFPDSYKLEWTADDSEMVRVR